MTNTGLLTQHVLVSAEDCLEALSVVIITLDDSSKEVRQLRDWLETAKNSRNNPQKKLGITYHEMSYEDEDILPCMPWLIDQLYGPPTSLPGMYNIQYFIKIVELSYDMNAQASLASGSKRRGGLAVLNWITNNPVAPVSDSE